MTAFAFLVDDRLYQTVFRFYSVEQFLQHQVSSVCLLMCNLHTLRLSALCVNEMDVLGTSSQTSIERIQRDLYVASTAWCRALPFCCEPASVPISRDSPRLLGIFEENFVGNNHFRELEWCSALRHALNSKEADLSGSLIPNRKRWHLGNFVVQLLQIDGEAPDVRQNGVEEYHLGHGTLMGHLQCSRRFEPDG